MKSTTSERLAELMNYYNINQADLIKKTGIPKSSMSMYVSGQRKPPQNKLTVIAEAYNVDEAWLMGYDVPMKGFVENDSEEIGKIIGRLFSKDGKKLEKLIRIFDQLDPETKNAYILIGEKMLINKINLRHTMVLV